MIRNRSPAKFVNLLINSFNMISIEGAAYQMLNHGISTGALFLLVGMIYERRHTRLIDDFGGIAHTMPVYAGVFLVITLSSIGLPGLNGFVGEFLILQGTFLHNHIYAVLGASAVIFAAVYMLWMYQRVFVGKVGGENSTLKDLNVRELVTIVPLIIMAIWMGVGSKSFITLMEPSIQQIVDRIDDARQDQIYRVENQTTRWTSDVD